MCLKKVNKKVLNVAIFMTFGALIIFSLEMTNNFKRQKNLVQDEYNKSMYLAVSYINNVEVDLAKLLVTSTPKMSAVTLADIWKQANLGWILYAAAQIRNGIFWMVLYHCRFLKSTFPTQFLNKKTVVLYNVLCFTHEICAVLMRKNFACFCIFYKSRQSLYFYKNAL